MNRTGSATLRFFSQSKRNWLGLAALVLLLVGNAAIRLAVAYYLGETVEYGVAGRFDRMMLAAARLAATLAGSFFYGIFLSGCSAWMVESFFARLRVACFQHAMHLPMERLEHRFSRGDLVVRINQDLTRLNETVVGKWAWLGQSAITAAVSLIRCFVICWPLALFYGCLLPLFVWLMAAISRSTQRQHREESEAASAAVQQAADIMNGFDMVKAYGLGAVMEGRFQAAGERMDTVSIAVGDKLVRLGQVRYALAVVTLLVVFLAGSCLLRLGWISLSGLISFLTLSQSVQTAIGLMDHIVYALRIARADLMRIDEILTQPLEEEEWNATGSQT